LLSKLCRGQTWRVVWRQLAGFLVCWWAGVRGARDSWSKSVKGLDQEAWEKDLEDERSF
jgi:hypothetical protein